MVLYKTIKRLIENAQTDGLPEKVDIFHTAGKLTDEQYAEIVGLLTKAE